MLSQRAKYGLKALLALARQKESRPLLVADCPPGIDPEKVPGSDSLATQEPGHRAKQEGARRGYLLLQPAEKVTFGQVIRILDGPLAPVRVPA